MNPLKIIAIAALAAALAASAQQAGEAADIKLPSGKSQQQEILKVEHQKAIEETAKLIKLAEELKADLEKDEYQVLSVSSLKKTEEIEKLARRIRERMRR
jgi:hypothetical protein